MYIRNVTDDDYITDEYNNSLLSNCTNSENNIVIIKPTLLLTIPCGLSFLCLISLIYFNQNFIQNR